MSRGKVWAIVLGFGAMGAISLGIYPVLTKQALAAASSSQADPSAVLFGWISVCLGVIAGYVAFMLWRRAPKEDEY